MDYSSIAVLFESMSHVFLSESDLSALYANDNKRLCDELIKKSFVANNLCSLSSIQWLNK